MFDTWYLPASTMVHTVVPVLESQAVGCLDPVSEGDMIEAEVRVVSVLHTMFVYVQAHLHTQKHSCT